MTAPRCLYCDKPIKKRMSVRYLRSREDAADRIGDSTDMTLPELPATIEEAQRYFNWPITRVNRRFPGQRSAGRICAVHGWDGQSYAPRYGHFCTVQCAAVFGRTMADKGARL